MSRFGWLNDLRLIRLKEAGGNEPSAAFRSQQGPEITRRENPIEIKEKRYNTIKTG